jgi:hypothetical protein
MKQKILIGVLIVAGLASIAYAAFSQSLVVNGTGTTTGDWNVKITGITNSASTGATQVNGSPTFTATSATFNTNLAYPGASATYQITVKNQGNINAKLDSISDIATINATAPSDIKYTITGVTAGTTTLAAGTTNVITVKVEWLATSTMTTNASKSATITFNYIQNTP